MFIEVVHVSLKTQTVKAIIMGHVKKCQGKKNPRFERTLF